MMLPEKEKVGRTPEIKLISELVSSVSLDRQVELKALIALSDEKIRFFINFQKNLKKIINFYWKFSTL